MKRHCWCATPSLFHGMDSGLGTEAHQAPPLGSSAIPYSSFWWTLSVRKVSQMEARHIRDDIGMYLTPGSSWLGSVEEHEGIGNQHYAVSVLVFAPVSQRHSPIQEGKIRNMVYGSSVVSVEQGPAYTMVLKTDTDALFALVWWLQERVLFLRRDDGVDEETLSTDPQLPRRLPCVWGYREITELLVQQIGPEVQVYLNEVQT